MNPVAEAGISRSSAESERYTGALSARPIDAERPAQPKPAGELVIDRLLRPRH